MGAGIAYVCARSGMEVVLKDVSLEAAEKGKALLRQAQREGGLPRQADPGEVRRAARPDHPDRRPRADLPGCDLVIEAVFEDPSLKDKVFAEVQPVVNTDALLCSNTSTLPITELAAGRRPPGGLHRPALLLAGRQDAARRDHPRREDLRGRAWPRRSTSSSRSARRRSWSTTAAASTPRGSSAPRSTRALAMLGEGVAPMTHRAGRAAGRLPGGAAADQRRAQHGADGKIRNATKAAVERDGGTYTPHPAEEVIDRMIDESSRPGKLKGAGFYDYDEPASKAAALGRACASSSRRPTRRARLRDLKERMLFIEAVETARCFDEGVIELDRRGEHRLDLRHRLPGALRRRRAVHQRLRGSRRHRRHRVRRPGPGARGGVRRAVRAAGQPGREGRGGRALPAALSPAGRPPTE